MTEHSAVTGQYSPRVVPWDKALDGYSMFCRPVMAPIDPTLWHNCLPGHERADMLRQLGIDITRPWRMSQIAGLWLAIQGWTVMDYIAGRRS